MHLVAVLAAMAGAAFCTSTVQATLSVADNLPLSQSISAGTMAGPFTLSVNDPGTPSGASDNITGFQVRMTIVPQAGFTGMLTFDSAGQPSSDDVFPSNDFFFSQITMGGLELFVTSAYTVAAGINVDSVGDNLYDFVFDATPDASGFFDIFINAGSLNTAWTDNAMPNPMSRQFDNVMFMGSDQFIGQIEVIAAVPEAGACAALALVSAMVGAWQLVRRRLV
jgi:hypothetical protein